MPHIIPLEERFWARVERRAPDECWPWVGATYEFGHGQIKGPLVRARFGGAGIGAHRLSWEIHRGPIPAGQHVLHRCDNPRCVNPAHLFLGSHRDNMADKLAKGRGRGASLSGEANGRAILSAEAVAEIRRLVAGGAQQKIIARRFGVHRSTVGRIVRREAGGWTHVRD